MSSPSIEPAWSVGESLERVIDAIRGRVNSIRRLSDGSYMVNCLNPAHPDEVPSLHISHLDDADGGHTAFFCQSQCGKGVYRDWAQWAGLEYDDLWDDRRWSRRRHQGGPALPARPRPQLVKSPWGRLGRKPDPICADLPALLGQPAAAKGIPDHYCDFVDVETYSYPDGLHPNRRVRRQRCTHDGCAAKNFPQSYLKKGADPEKPSSWGTKAEAGWGSDWSDQLYRHFQVVDAVHDGMPVWILEGEKDVHTAEGRGLVATTNPGGAGNFPSHLAEVFRGAAEVNIPIDRDPAGTARAVRLHELLSAQGVASIRMWLPATSDAKSDFTDHFNAGHQLEDLIAVPLPAVMAWHLLEDVKRHGTVANLGQQLQTAAAEQDAQLLVTDYDRQHRRRAMARDRTRFAARWAKEAVLVYQELLQAAEALAAQVRLVPADDPGRRWAEQAAEIAQAQLRAGRSLVLALTERVKLILPATVNVDDVVLSIAPAEPAADALEEDSARTQRHLHAVPGGGGGGNNGNGGGVDDPLIRIERDQFEVVNGEVIQVLWAKMSDGTHIKRHRSVINAPIRLVAKEIAEDDEAIEADNLSLNEIPGREGRDGTDKIRNLTQMTHVVVEVPDAEGNPARLRVAFDDYDSGTFLSHLPVANLQFARGRAGRDKVITAVNYISNATIATSYRATGWRRRSDGSYMYVTADGAIDADGWRALPTNLSGPMSRFNLPNPTVDPARLREVFLEGTAEMLARFPERVTAVLVGQAFRAAICPSEWTTVLSGSPGSKKTGMAALAMHYFGETWDRTRPASSMSGNGATDNAVRIMANQAKDAVLFLDDNAPTAGLDAAYKRLEATNRLLSNQEGRPRSTRDGQGNLPETKPRTTGLITSEMPARAGSSGGRRELLVPLAKHDISLDAVKDLDTMAARHARAMLMSSYLQWVAADHRGAMLRCRQLRDEFEHLIHGRDDVHPVAAANHGTKVAELWGGWALLLEFLQDRGAITEREQLRWAAMITEALIEAAETAEDPDAVESTGQRVCDLLRHALGTGLAFAADASTGGAPARLERRLGWHTSNGTVGVAAQGPTEWRTEPRAICLGYVAPSYDQDDDDLELIVDRPTLDAVIKAAAAGMTDASGTDPGTVERALIEEGILKTEIEETPTGRSIVRKGLLRTIGCLPDLKDPDKPLRQRRFVLRLAALFGERPGWPDQTSRPAVGPTPGQDPCGETGTAPGEDPELADPDVPQSVDDTYLDQTPATSIPAAGGAMDHTNAAGLTLPRIAHLQTRPCVACGKSCGVELGGLALHPPCFWVTTATTVKQLREQVAAPRGSHRTQVSARRNEQVAEGSSSQQTSAGAGAAPPTVRGGPVQSTAGPSNDAASAGFSNQPTVPVLEQGRRRRKTAQPSRFAAAVAVVDVDGVWLPDGSRRDLPNPIRHVGDLEQLGRDLRLGLPPVGWKTFDQPGTVVPTAALWAQLGVDVAQLAGTSTARLEALADLSARLPAVRDAVAMGWVLGREDSPQVLKGCTKLRRRDQERASVQILLTAGLSELYGLGGDVPAAGVARRLQLFADTMGVPFTGAPSTAGLDLFKALAPKNARDQIVAVDWSEVVPALNHMLEKQLNWTRTPLEDERGKQWLVLMDRGQSYLATWSGLRLGYGPPEHRGAGVVFDRYMSGWWSITVPDNTVDGRPQRLPYPDVLDPDGTASGLKRWVTTPALEYAIVDEGRQVEIHEAWVWPKARSGFPLKGMYEQINAGLTALRVLDGPDADAAMILAKETYKQFSGYLISDRAAAAGEGMHQPYWHHAIIAKARTAILRQIKVIGEQNSRAGRPNTWPLVVSNTDLIGYAADNIDPPEAAWPGSPDKLGEGPGRYKPQRYAPMAEQLKFLNHRGWNGLKATRTFADAGGEPAGERP